MNNIRLHVKDLQFARYFLANEIDLKDDIVHNILDYEVEIKFSGDPDTVVNRGNLLVVHSPSSVTRFLFSVLYNLLSTYLYEDIYRDKLGLGLLFMCKNYVYADFNPRQVNGPPVLISFEKNSVPKFIIQEIIEPLIGSVYLPPVFYIKCKFTDICREIKGSNILTGQYNLSRIDLSNSDFPMILCNTAIQNTPAEMVHLTVKAMEMSLGIRRTHKVIKNILLSETNDLMKNLVLILKTLRGEPDFVIDFLKFLGSHVILTKEELESAEKISTSIILNDSYLGEKLAGDNVTPQVFKQWSQWSLLMGLIEKQLTPMRGSMWPASTTIKPHEDKLRLRQKEIAQKKGKNQLNFEELLETYRNTFEHKAIEPGKIIEYMMKDNRIWK